MVLSRPLRIVTAVCRRSGKIGLALGLALLSTAVTAQDRGPRAREAATLDGGAREGRHGADQLGLQSTPALFSVEYKDRNLSVNAEQTPLAQILREVVCQTAVEVRGLEGLQDEVSVRFAGLPLREGLEKLLAPVNYLLLEEPSPQEGMRPTRVLVFGRRAASPPQAVPGEVISGEEDQVEDLKERLKELDAFAQQGDVQALRKALSDPDDLIQMKALELLVERDDPQGAVALLLDMTKSDQPAMQFQALRLLHEAGQADEGTVVSALGEALADKAVRNYAIQALAERGGSDAMGYLRQAFRDPNPEVRKLVIESAAQQDQSRPLLQEAISDPDETVRSFATFWLKEIASGGKGDSSGESP